MSIFYDETERIFRLDTPNTSYMIGLADDGGFLGHVCYGPRIPDNNMGYLMRTQEWPRLSCQNQGTRASFFDFFPWEYPAWGGGDFRQSCLRVRAANGSVSCTPAYRSHRIFSGKPALSELPSAFAGDTECETLEIVCQDDTSGLKVFQYYSAFSDVDAICRSVRVEKRREGTDRADHNPLRLPGHG